MPNAPAIACVIFSLVTGAAVALVIDVLNTHDIKLARQLYQFLNPLDILIKPRGMCGNSVSSDLRGNTTQATLVALFHYRLGVTRYRVVLQSTLVQAIMN
jgi:hypothetical protein